MKNKLKIFVSAILCLCMALGFLPLSAAADPAPAFTAYDEADDGDLLYTVNWACDDGVLDSSATNLASGSDVVSVSGENNSVLTFANKAAAAADFYGGYLKDFRIVGHVYTVSFYTQNTDSYNMGMRFFNNGSGTGVGFSRFNGTQTAVGTGGTYNYKYLERMTGFYTGMQGNSPYVDGDKKINYKVVIDGIANVAKFYVQINSEGIYELFGKTPINPTSPMDYLAMIVYENKVVGEPGCSVGNVNIYKGDTVGGSNPSRTLWQNTAYGTALYNISFAADNGTVTWGSYRAVTGATPSQDGSSVTLYGEAAGGRYYGGYLPMELATAGNYTYEFFVSSTGSGNTRTSVQVFGYSLVNSTAWLGAGFAYFNTAASSQFCYNGGNYGAAGNSTITGADNGFTTTSYTTSVQPDTSDDTKPNVKIEFDVLKRTITNYVLSNGEFVKVSMLSYGLDVSKAISYHGLPMILLQNYDAGTTSVYKDFKIVKGLSVTGGVNGANEDRYVAFKVDGKYVSDGYALSTSTALPTLEERPGFRSKLVLKNTDTVIDDLSDLDLTYGLNLVELESQYTAISDLEMCGIQTSVHPDTVNNLTSVRFIASVNNIANYSKVGFRITAKYKDAGGTTHVSTNTLDKYTTSVYTSIAYTDVNGTTGTVSANEFEGVEYLAAIVIDNVPIGENVQVDFTITPYLLPVEGEEIVFAARTYSFVNGQYNSTVDPLS